MEYKIKYPKIKYFDKNTGIPNYIIIKTDCEKIKITHSDAKKYIKECEKNNKSYIKIYGEFDYINIHIDNIIEAFKPKDGLGYKIKDKLLRNPGITCIVILQGVFLINDIKKNKKIGDLKEKLEEMTELANDPSNAGRVLRSQRKL